MCERFAFINNGHFTDQNLGVFWYREACQFSNFIGWLTNDSRVQRTVFQDNILNSFQLFTLQQIAAVGCKTFTYSVINRVNNNNRLFRSTDYAVVEGFDISTDATARLISAVSSITTGVLPAPTPIAGLPELYAALTMPGPPVARIRLMSGWCISALDSSTEG